jgi:hypothetical protein
MDWKSYFLNLAIGVATFAIFFFFPIWMLEGRKPNLFQKDFYIDTVEVFVEGLGIDRLWYGFDEGNKNVNFIKSGTMNTCKNKTTGKMIDDFMGNPKWSGIIGTDKKEYVNVKGNITYLEKEITALIQFSLNKPSFSVRSLEFNEIPQNQLILNTLLKTMCDYSVFKRVQ